MKKKLSVGLAFSMALLLIASAALAAATQWGILDFMSNRGGEDKVLPEASAMIQQEVPQQSDQTNEAAFTLREAIFDGKALYMVVAAQPQDPKVLLIGADAMPSDPIAKMGPQFEGLAQTIMDYASKNDYQRIVNVNIADDAMALGEEGYFNSMDYVLEADGTLVFMLRGPFETSDETLPIELICTTTPYKDITVNDELDVTLQRQSDLTFTLEAAQVRVTKKSAETAIFVDCGVQVDGVTLKSTAMATYYRIEYTVADAQAYAATDGGLYFEFLDEQGIVIENGSMSSESVIEVDGSNGSQFVQEGSLIAMNDLPERIMLRGYNAWEKNMYETHEVKMN